MEHKQNQQQTGNNQQETQEEPKLEWIITEPQAEFLQNFRQELINQRAYEILNMSQDTLFAAAQANGYSRGRLALIDELLDAAKVLRNL